jgi:predicted transcriptional regulator
MGFDKQNCVLKKSVQFVVYVPVSSVKNPALDKEVQFLKSFACKYFKGLTVLDRSKQGEGVYENKVGEIDQDFISLFLVVVEDLPINRMYVEQMRRHIQIALHQEDVWALETSVTLHKFEDSHKISEAAPKLSPNVNKLAKTLSNPKRTDIISSISQQNKRLSDIAKDCHISKQNCVTKLNDLQDTGLVVAQGYGTRRRYGLSPLVQQILEPFSQAEQALACVFLLKKLHEHVKVCDGKMVIDQSKKEAVKEIVQQLNQQLLWERIPQDEQDFFLRVEEALFQN